jgi:hypothetical protein
VKEKDPRVPPDPPWLEELLDAAREVQMSPELEAELDRKVYAAVAEDRRRRGAEAKPRSLPLRVLAFVCLACAAAGGIALAVRGPKPAPPVADKPAPTDHRRSRELPLLSDTAPGPVPSATAEEPDAGPAHPPGKR